jgi:hypothetical protein
VHSLPRGNETSVSVRSNVIKRLQHISPVTSQTEIKISSVSKLLEDTLSVDSRRYAFRFQNFEPSCFDSLHFNNILYRASAEEDVEFLDAEFSKVSNTAFSLNSSDSLTILNQVRRISICCAYGFSITFECDLR